MFDHEGLHWLQNSHSCGQHHHLNVLQCNEYTQCHTYVYVTYSHIPVLAIGFLLIPSYICTAWTLLPHLVSSILVGVTHNLELPTEHTLPSSLSTSTPVQSPVTASTGLVHALCYGFMIIICAKPFSHSAWRKTRSTCSQLVCIGILMQELCHPLLFTVHIHKLSLPNQASESHAQLHKFCLLECHMHATHTVHLT